MNEVYQAVTGKILEALGKGDIPWRRPWRCPRAVNIITRKPYQGINVLLTILPDFVSPFWMTFKQATDLGGHIKKGEKSSQIIFYKSLVKTDNDGNPILNSKGESVTIPMLRYSNVFNLEQTEGIPNPEPIPEIKGGLEEAARLVNEAKLCPIRHGGVTACWYPEDDYIQMPGIQRFKTQELYYHSLFHEMGHATGHPSRLNRDTSIEKTDYAKEELEAELTASFLSNRIGIMDKVSFDHPTGYIQSWLKALKDDPKMVVQVAAQAEKATAFITGQSLQIETGESPSPSLTQTRSKALELPAWATSEPGHTRKHSTIRL